MSLPLADWPQQAPDLGIAGLRLRPLRDADAAAWYAYLSDDNVTRHTSWQLDGPDALVRLIRGYADPVATHAMRLAIVEADDRLIGTIGLNEITPGARRAEIAYDLAPSHWRRGIASQACEAVTGWALQTLGLARVQATVLDTNTASAGVLERCRFQREELLHHYRQVRGEPRHFWIYARIWPPALLGAECG
ncbi:GNAT family N-acetyltransferase [Achromobacter xylosoxidans]|uniref:N-acetyltransferase n=1 Tax=Alcaligenes xylosoxydans xylosoxydans TaxID=85698 RepID=A0A0X8P5Z4_ALCXX|nr:GNAT family N-acetyltransferase [Achromobacter xylosoxidans]AMG40466.1 N-acetyltransferase [Achromobacter xylosoxidans]